MGEPDTTKLLALIHALPCTNYYYHITSVFSPKKLFIEVHQNRQSRLYSSI